MSETFLHNLWVTVFYVVTWPVALVLMVAFALNAIDGPINVTPRASVMAFAVGACLFILGMTAAVSGVEWRVVS